MKKKILALFLGGVMAAGSLSMSMPATAQAALVKFDECEDSTSHIKSAQVAAVDGKLTVTIDINFETGNGQFFLYVFDEQLEKRDVGLFQFYDTQWGEGTAAKLEKLKESGTYTFDGLAGDKTYYVYCNVEDNHEINGWGEGGDPNDTFWHYAAYLGSCTPGGTSTGNGSSGGNSSDGAPAHNESSGSKDEKKEISYENVVLDQIQTAETGSTVVMEKGVTTLSNAVMKKLLEKSDVSLKLEFTYQDEEYVIVIPAGAAIDNDIPYYGPLYLALHFGNKAGTEASGAGDTYEVQSGDCLSKIAAANSMTLKQLLAKNPQIKDPDKIMAGQKINR